MRRVFGLPILDFSDYAECVSGHVGLEIGGPSQMFRRDGLIPLYNLAASINNCNFTSDTVWAKDLVAGNTFKFSPTKPAGTQ